MPLQVISTLGKFVHGANLSNRDSNRTTDHKYIIKILQTLKIPVSIGGCEVLLWNSKIQAAVQ